ncbi:hypothetical protein CEXT_408851 [Caerostris extrusa]|uniref:Uncharacterized protein n=1 Tax=Caerostris extrusa TaxID=172846 RepID=A0AAV4S4H8_CAEEX|nr:hypothetical protein CEXT_408851 [Caerostris extrusa]
MSLSNSFLASCRTFGDLKISRTVMAIALPASNVGPCASVDPEPSANSLVWLMLSAWMANMGWMEGITCDTLPMSVEPNAKPLRDDPGSVSIPAKKSQKE